MISADVQLVAGMIVGFGMSWTLTRQQLSLLDRKTCVPAALTIFGFILIWVVLVRLFG
jgi:hypothetical protein